MRTEDLWRAGKVALTTTGLSRRDILRLSALAAGTVALGCGDAGTDDDSDSASDAQTAVSEPPLSPVAWGVQPAPGLPAPKFVHTNGIRMGLYDTGAAGGGGNPTATPVVFSHGFPELAYSWRHQIPAVAQAGYRAIAPDQRGYGLTERPESVEEYSLLELCADMVGMLDALDIERAVFCGHDWGGGIVWMMPRLYPERVLGVIGVNTPTSHPEHPRTSNDSLIVQSERYYTNTFQPPGEAEAVLEEDVRRTFEFMMREGGIWDVEEFGKLPEDSAERRMDLLTMIENRPYPGELLLNETELAYFVDTFEKTGFTGGLNWYRAARSSGPAIGAAVKQWDIDRPCMYVGAEDDIILRPSSADAMAGFIDDFEQYTIEDCGHWTQQEQPAELNRLLLEWLGRKFPVA